MSQLRVFGHAVSAKGAFWRQEWRGPALVDVSALDASADGEFAAFARARSHVLELWDMSGHPSRMCVLAYDAPCEGAAECKLLKWSSRKSHLAAVYHLRVPSRRLDLAYLLVWNLHSLSVVFSAWYVCRGYFSCAGCACELTMCLYAGYRSPSRQCPSCRAELSTCFCRALARDT